MVLLVPHLLVYNMHLFPAKAGLKVKMCIKSGIFVLGHWLLFITGQRDWSVCKRNKIFLEGGGVLMVEEGREQIC